MDVADFEDLDRITDVQRDEGHLFLHGLESNPGSSLQTEEESGQLPKEMNA